MRKPNKYYGKTLSELFDAMKYAEDGKEARELHRAMKKIDRRSGMRMSRRYPYMPAVVMGAAVVIQLVGIIFCIVWDLTH